MMTSRNQGKTNITGLGILALVCIALAAGVYITQNKSTEKKFKPEKLFKKLDVKGVSEVKVIGLADTITLKKQSDEAWGLEQRGGYPAEKEKIRRLVYSVANLEPSDKMTEDPKKYEKLGVTDEKPEKGRVQLLDAQGKVLAGLYIGQDRKAADDGSGAGFRPADGQYIRVEGDPAVYKIKDAMTLDLVPTSWLSRELLKIQEPEIQEVKLDHGETTSTFTVTRTGIDPFKLKDATIPEGMREKPGMTSSVGRALVNFTLKDVLPPDDPKASEIQFNSAYRATMKNGLVYVVQTGEKDSVRYAKISADYNKEADYSLRDERTSDTVTAKAMEIAETTKTKVNERHGKWIYMIETWVYDNLAKKFSDMIEAIPPAQPPAPGSGPGAPGDPHAGAPGLPSTGDPSIQSLIDGGEPPGSP